MYRPLARILKKGGKLVIVTKNAYTKRDFVDHKEVARLEKEGILKLVSRELFDGYRRLYEFEAEDPLAQGVMLTYEALK